MRQKVYYLGPDYINDIKANRFNDYSKWFNEIAEHPETITYSVAGFENAFNDESISDLGYIAITAF